MLTFSEFHEYFCSMYVCKWHILPKNKTLPYASLHQALIDFPSPLSSPLISICEDNGLNTNFSKSALIIQSDETKPSSTLSHLPILTTPAKGYDIIESLLPFLQKHLRPAIPYHGVFLDIFGKGVLITGEPGCGKSECALALLSKQHRLIADDIVYFYRIKADKLVGFTKSRGLLEVRDLGIIDVHQHFGPLCTMEEKPLDLIISLTPNIPERTIKKELAETIISNVSVPTLSLNLAFKRDLAMLIESAVQFAFSPPSTVIENLLTLPTMASTESTS